MHILFLNMARAVIATPTMSSIEYGAQLLKHFSDTVRSSSSYYGQEPLYANPLHEYTRKQPFHWGEAGRLTIPKDNDGNKDIDKTG